MGNISGPESGGGAPESGRDFLAEEEVRIAKEQAAKKKRRKGRHWQDPLPEDAKAAAGEPESGDEPPADGGGEETDGPAESPGNVVSTPEIVVQGGTESESDELRPADKGAPPETEGLAPEAPTMGAAVEESEGPTVAEEPASAESVPPEPPTEKPAEAGGGEEAVLAEGGKPPKKPRAVRSGREGKKTGEKKGDARDKRPTIDKEFQDEAYEAIKESYDPFRTYLRDAQLDPKTVRYRVATESRNVTNADTLRTQAVGSAEEFTNLHDALHASDRIRKARPDDQLAGKIFMTEMEDLGRQLVDPESDLSKKYREAGNNPDEAAANIAYIIETVRDTPEILRDEYAEAVARGEVENLGVSEYETLVEREKGRAAEREAVPDIEEPKAKKLQEPEVAEKEEAEVDVAGETTTAAEAGAPVVGAEEKKVSAWTAAELLRKAWGSSRFEAQEKKISKPSAQSVPQKPRPQPLEPKEAFAGMAGKGSAKSAETSEAKEATTARPEAVAPALAKEEPRPEGIAERYAKLKPTPRNSDPIRRFLMDTVKLRTKELKVNELGDIYEVIVGATAKDGVTLPQIAKFDNYHAALERAGAMSEEERGKLNTLLAESGTGLTADRPHVRMPAWAEKKIPRRIGGELGSLIGRMERGEEPDEYPTALAAWEERNKKKEGETKKGGAEAAIAERTYPKRPDTPMRAHDIDAVDEELDKAFAMRDVADERWMAQAERHAKHYPLAEPGAEKKSPIGKKTEEKKKDVAGLHALRERIANQLADEARKAVREPEKRENMGETIGAWENEGGATRRGPATSSREAVLVPETAPETPPEHRSEEPGEPRRRPSPWNTDPVVRFLIQEAGVKPGDAKKFFGSAYEVVVGAETKEGVVVPDTKKFASYHEAREFVERMSPEEKERLNGIFSSGKTGISAGRIHVRLPKELVGGRRPPAELEKLLERIASGTEPDAYPAAVAAWDESRKKTESVVQQAEEAGVAEDAEAAGKASKKSRGRNRFSGRDMDVFPDADLAEKHARRIDAERREAAKPPEESVPALEIDNLEELFGVVKTPEEAAAAHDAMASAELEAPGFSKKTWVPESEESWVGAENQAKAKLGDERQRYIEAQKEFWLHAKPKSSYERSSLESIVKSAHRAGHVFAGDRERLHSEDEHIRKGAEERKLLFQGELSRRMIGGSRAKLEAIYNAELAKTEYENVKVGYLTDVIDRARAGLERTLGKPWEEFSAEEREFADSKIARHRAGAYLNLYSQEERALRAADFESYPPEKREGIRGVWNQGMKKYLAMHWSKRALIGAVVASGAFVGAGAIGAGSVVSAPLFFTTRRVITSLGFGGLSQLVGKGVERIRRGKREEIAQKKRSGVERVGKEFTPMEIQSINKSLQEIAAAEESGLRTERKIKVAAILGTSLVAGGTLGYLLGAHEAAASGAPRASGAAHAVPHPEPAPAPAAHPGVDQIPLTGRRFGLLDLEPPRGATPHEKLVELATVRRGEGAWQAVRRQLLDRLEHDPQKFGLKSEDLNNAAKVDQVLDAKTLDILKHEGFINSDGTTKLGMEIDSRVVLSPDDHIAVEGRGTYDYHATHGEEAADAVPETEVQPLSADEQAYIAGSDVGVPDSGGAAADGSIAASHPGPISGGEIMSEAITGRIPGTEVLGENGRAFLEKFAADHPDLMRSTDAAAVSRNMKDALWYALRADSLTDVEMSTLDQAEYWNEGYLRVIRSMPVKDFLSRFPWGAGGKVDPKVIGAHIAFELNGDTAHPVITDRYVQFANALKALAGRSASAEDATIERLLTTVSQ